MSWIEYEIRDIESQDNSDGTKRAWVGSINGALINSINLSQNYTSVYIGFGMGGIDLKFELLSQTLDTYEAFKKVLSAEGKCKIEIKDVGFVRKI